MKAGSFNIHDYLGKLYEGVNEEDLGKLYEEEKAETETGKPDEGLIQQGGENKAYNWLKKEYHKGKTEVKVEMSSHEFKPGYHLDTNLKSVNDFKPELSGHVKTSDSPKGMTDKAVPFPETKFPGGGETIAPGNDKSNKNESSEKKDGSAEKKPAIKVEAKTKDAGGKNDKSEAEAKTKEGKGAKELKEGKKEIEEGNEFSGELNKARKKGKKKFTIKGKTYPVKKK
jgi:hypothetical protein